MLYHESNLCKMFIIFVLQQHVTLPIFVIYRYAFHILYTEPNASCMKYRLSVIDLTYIVIDVKGWKLL